MSDMGLHMHKPHKITQSTREAAAEDEEGKVECGAQSWGGGNSVFIFHSSA